MYQSLEATLHDAFWASEGDVAEMPLIQSFLSRNPGPSLELGCGSGRLMLPLLEEGHTVYGIDNSSEMLCLLKEKAEQCSLKADAHLASLTDFSPPHPIQSILIPAFTLQLVSREEAMRCLHRCRESVSASGSLYITVFIPWAEITGELPENTFYPDHEAKLECGSNAQCKTKHEINRYEQSLKRTHLYSVASSTKTQQHTSEQTLQWYHKNELKLMLELAQWNIVEIITDLSTHSQDSKDAQILTLYCDAI